MSKTIFVVPAPVAEGELPRVAIHPERPAPLPEAGGWWPDDFFTAARLRGGDVIEAPPPDPEEPQTDPAAQARRARR